MQMQNQITDKATIKLYGDKKTSQQIVDILTAEGFKVFGSIATGNAYVTKKGDVGWASNVTVIYDPKKVKEDDTKD